MVTLSKSRIEALSDGVFSIAMMLLVLKLEVPEHHHSNNEMLRQLAALHVATFLVAGGFWFLHHLTFHFIRHVNGFLVWVNLIFLMFVSLLPFSAGLMGTCGCILDHRAAESPLAMLAARDLPWSYTWAVSYSFCWPD
jgi:uncharacterized membrane protein